MVSTKEVILEYVCPGLGVICSNVMFSASYRDLKQSVVKGDLGSLNPTPWAFMLGNCCGWVTYSILIQNYFIFFGNCPGFILSSWLNMGAVKLQYENYRSNEMRKSFVNYLNDQQSSRLLTTKQQQQQEEEEDKTLTCRAIDFGKVVWEITSQTTKAPAPHENMVLCVIIFWVIVITIISFGNFDPTINELIIGVIANLNLVFFYGAPLSTIFTVLKTRSSSTIHIWTMLTNTANGVFWCAYGVAVTDYFVIVPNGLGAILGGIQMILCVLFPRTAATNITTKEDELAIIEKETYKTVHDMDVQLVAEIKNNIEVVSVESITTAKDEILTNDTLPHSA